MLATQASLGPMDTTGLHGATLQVCVTIWLALTAASALTSKQCVVPSNTIASGNHAFFPSSRVYGMMHLDFLYSLDFLD